MIRRSACLWLVKAVIAVNMTQARIAPGAKQLPQVNPAVVRITTDTGMGTGFLVGRDGSILTAYHVIAGAATAWAQFPANRTCRITAVAIFPRRDLALVRVDPADLPPHIPIIALTSATTAAAGAHLTVIGYPADGAQTSFDAVLYVQAGRSGVLQLSADVRGGCSGGPVLNASGEAIGVVTGGFHGIEDLSYASALAEPSQLAVRDTDFRSIGSGLSTHEEQIADLYGRALHVLAFWRDRVESGEDASGSIAAAEWAAVQLARVIEVWPDQAFAYLNEGICRFRMGQIREATTLLQENVRLDPHSLAAHWVLASLLARGNGHAALTQARDVVSIAPEFATGHRVLGQLYAYQKDLVSAENELNIAVGLSPHNLETRIALGDVYLRRKRFPEAVREFREALAIKSACARAHFGLGLACIAVGDRSQAGREMAILKPLDLALARQLERRLHSIMR
jgi:Tfp pilus assembly protein PilF